MRKLILILFVSAASQFLHADAVSYGYDDAGRLTSVGYPNGTSISYSYDAAGNLTARTVSSAGASSKKPQPKTASNRAELSKTGKQTPAQKTGTPTKSTDKQ